VSTHEHDVIIVGAGLAGLSAAVWLRDAGIRATVLEASDGVGGRLRTDKVDGYLLDRGFAVHNPGYSEAPKVLDHDALDLKPFEA
jgi:phytoene dehydrogenase-like protein